MTMKPIFVGFLLIFTSFLNAADSAATERFRKYTYLTVVANAIHDLDSRTYELRSDDLSRLALQVCKALETLKNDKQFNEDVRAMAKLTRERQEFRNSIRQELNAFIESFMRQEASFLRRAGLSEEAVRRITAGAGYLRTALNEPAQPEAILLAADWLCGDVCSAVEWFNKMSPNEKMPSDAKLRVSRWAQGVEGLSLLALHGGEKTVNPDLTSAAYTIGGQMLVLIQPKQRASAD